MRKAAALILPACLILFTAPGVHAETLDHVESSHQPASSSSSSSSDNIKSKGHSGAGAARLVTGILEAFLRSSGRSSGSDSPTGGWSPPSLAIEPYETRSKGIYVTRAEEGHRIVRHAELSFGGWFAEAPLLYAHTLNLRGFAGPFVLDGEWSRWHEPGAVRLDSLDVFRARIGINILAGSTSHAELYPMVGALGLHGNDVTAAFDAGAELRLYPVRPLVVAASFQGAFFKDGAPLLEARLEPGVSISRIDLRLGAMWIHQDRTISSLGPSATIAVRW